MIQLFFCHIALFLSISVNAETIRITNGEWQPYLSEFSYEYGLSSHIVTEAFKLEGIDVEYGFFPWKRSYELAKNAKGWDASAVWWPTEAAKKDFYVSAPVIETYNVFFHLKSEKFDWKQLKDIEGLSVGITEGYDYGEEFAALVAKRKIIVQVDSSDEENYRKLLAKKIKIFPNDPVVGYAQLRDIFTPEKLRLFTNHHKKFEQRTLNLLISKKCKKGFYYLKKFNSGLLKLQKSGRLKEMFKDLDVGVYNKQSKIWSR